MAAAATTSSSSHLLLLSRQQAASLRCRLSFLGQPARRSGRVTAQAPAAKDVRCMAAVDTAASAAAAETSPKSSSYEIVTLTTWLLQQERTGAIDNEMTIVLASISTACKQIAALVQRAPISNLTGVQGAVNVQGEDQKKLDVVSNEVIN
jgi:fructose-1,6-bisphosphatase I